MKKIFKKKSICMTFCFMLIVPLLAAKDTVFSNNTECLIDSGKFTVKVARIDPSSASTLQANTIYTLTIRNDSVYSNLPYFGRSYPTNYIHSNGLEMETSISDYTVKKRDKGMKEVKFVSQTKDDTYKWTLRFETNGSVEIHVSMRNRQPIRFVGTVSSVM